MNRNRGQFASRIFPGASEMNFRLVAWSLKRTPHEDNGQPLRRPLRQVILTALTLPDCRTVLSVRAGPQQDNAIPVRGTLGQVAQREQSCRVILAAVQPDGAGLTANVQLNAHPPTSHKQCGGDPDRRPHPFVSRRGHGNVWSTDYFSSVILVA